MATIAHCLFCFDALAAELDGSGSRAAMTLAEVQKSWAQYVKATAASSSSSSAAAKTTTTPAPAVKRLPALQRLAAAAAASSSSSSSTDSSGSLSSSSTGLLSSSSNGISNGGSGVETPATSVSSLSLVGDDDKAAAEDGEEEEEEEEEEEYDNDNDNEEEEEREEGEEEDGDEDYDEEADDDKFPLFVTWNIAPSSSSPADYNLRGCIGTFEPLPLEEGLSSYALTSALRDRRFDPIAAREVPRLEVCVTLLQDFEDAEGPDDWVLGTHGLRIAFHYHGHHYGATYLPDVAPEQGWNKEETVVSLMRKAGWTGRRERWREVVLRVVRYQGRKASLEYKEYKAWRDWVDSQ